MASFEAFGCDPAELSSPAPEARRSSGPVTGPEERAPSYWLPGLGAAAVLAAIAASAAWVYGVPGRGAASAFSLLFGAAFGILMQRGRFCFYCMFRDLIERRDPRPFYSLLAALAVGSVCYVVIFSAFLPTPTPGRLPPDAHIGPVSWALPAAGIAFGLGMTLSGACISGHLYRLGEGYTRAPFALAGAVIGFGAGFFSWRTLYLATISKAPVSWLPHALGYSGALAVQLAAIGLIALLLTRYLPGARAVPQAGPQSAAAATAPAAGNEPLSSDCSADPAQLRALAAVLSTLPPESPSPAPGPSPQPSPAPSASPASGVPLAELWQRIFVQRWSPGITGAAVGVLGALAYFRVAPLGVTSQLGSIARTWLTDAGLLAGRLNGLDAFRGCVTMVVHTISDNGLFISALTAASFAMAVVGRRFKLSRLTVKGAVSALGGGILMGWGSMIALGCTVGTLLSGIMAFSLSGWVFFGSVLAGVWAGLKLGLHRLV